MPFHTRILETERCGDHSRLEVCVATIVKQLTLERRSMSMCAEGLMFLVRNASSQDILWLIRRRASIAML